MSTATEFTVVGGGIGGLVVARRLAMAGRTVQLIEASDHLGGTVARHTVGGIDLDAGAESFATRGGTVAALAGALGLGSDLVAPAESGAWLQPASGVALPLPAVGLVGIPGSPRSADVVAVVGSAAAWRATFDRFLPARPARTLGELVRYRMGSGVLERLVAPVVHGVYSVHPDDLPLSRVAGLSDAVARTGSLAAAVLSLRAAAPAGAAVQGLVGGVHQLVDALAADLVLYGVTISLSSPISSLDGLPGTVIVAAPGLLAPSDGRRVTLATLVVDVPALDAAPRGTGVLVASGAPVHARALTHATAKWQWLREVAGGKHVLRLSYDDVPDGLAEVARVDAEVLLGASIPAAAVVDFARVDWLRPTPLRDAGQHIVVGETVGGTGLAGIVAHATATADRLLA